MARTIGPMPYHVVKQGEHLSRIAADEGFADYRTIWNHAENSDLKQRRQSAHILLPGDQVYIPEKASKEESRPSEETHRFRLKGKPLKLRLVVKDFDDRPLAHTPCKLELQDMTYDMETDKDGLLETQIPRTAETGRLTIPDLGVSIPIKVGHLDPIGEDSGCQARLQNLGYYSGPLDELDEVRLRYAIEEFQCDRQLKVTGVLDTQTRAKLKDAHGC